MGAAEIRFYNRQNGSVLERFGADELTAETPFFGSNFQISRHLAGALQTTRRGNRLATRSTRMGFRTPSRSPLRGRNWPSCSRRTRPESLRGREGEPLKEGPRPMGSPRGQTQARSRNRSPMRASGMEKEERRPRRAACPA